MSKLIRASKSNPCDVCGRTSTCSHDLDTGIYLCFGRDSTDSKFKAVKNLDNGFTVFVLSDSFESADSSFTRERRIKRDREQAQIRKAKPILKTYSQTLSDLIGDLPLTKEHEEILTLKGIQNPYALGYRSIVKNQRFFNKSFNQIPGFSDFRYVGSTGILCPAKGIDGSYQGFQVKPDDVVNGAKYKWTKTYDSDGNELLTAHLKNGELPMNFVINHESDEVGLIEGILKPVPASQIHKVNLIGASGGKFQFHQLRQFLKNNDIKTVTFYPDAGSVANPNTFNRDKKTLKTLVELSYKHKFKIRVAFWGHLLDKLVGDLDEIEAGTNMTYLSVSEFCEFDQNLVAAKAYKRLYESDNGFSLIDAIEFGNKLNHDQQRRKLEFSDKDAVFVAYDPEKKELPKSDYVSFQQENRNEVLELALKSRHKVILDKSGCGTGKSHGIDAIDLKTLFGDSDHSKIIYLSKSPLNPPTKGIELGFTPFLGRSAGFTEVEGKQTPSGYPLMRRTKTGEQVTELGNCKHADSIQAIREANSKVNVCKMCPMRADCASFNPETDEKIDAYGFLAQASRASKAKKVRMNYNALQDGFITDETIIVADEISQNFESVKVTEIGLTTNFLQTYSQALEIQLEFGYEDPEIKTLVEFLHKLKKVWESNFQPLPRQGNCYAFVEQAILKKLGINEFDYHLLKAASSKLSARLEMLNADFVNAAMKSTGSVKAPLLDFTSDLIDVVYGKIDGSIRIEGYTLSLFVRNVNGASNLLKGSKLLVLDATLSREHLAKILGVPESEILVISQEVPLADRLNVTLYTGAGNFLKNRTNRQIAAVEKVRKEIEESYGKENVGTIDYLKFSKNGDLNHFSDGRGSNLFQDKKALIIIGVPFSNLGAQADTFKTLYGESVGEVNGTINPQFTAFYQHITLAEIVQEIGRLRHNRRSEKLDCYILGDIDLRSLSATMGFNLKEVPLVREFPTLGTLQENKRQRILEAFEAISNKKNLESITATDLALEMGVKQPQVSKAAKSFGGFRRMREVLSLVVAAKADPQELEKVTPDLKLAALTYLPELVPLAQQNDDYLNEFKETIKIISESNGVSQDAVLSYMPAQTRTELISEVIASAPRGYRSYLFSRLRA